MELDAKKQDRGGGQTMSVNIDANINNADWTKRTWDLPPYKSEEFLGFLKFTDMTLEQFKILPVYRHAIKNGLIVDDEWHGYPQR